MWVRRRKKRTTLANHVISSHLIGLGDVCDTGMPPVWLHRRSFFSRFAGPLSHSVSTRSTSWRGGTIVIKVEGYQILAIRLIGSIATTESVTTSLMANALHSGRYLFTLLRATSKKKSQFFFSDRTDSHFQFSAVPWPTGSSGGHYGRFRRDPLPLHSGTGRETASEACEAIFWPSSDLKHRTLDSSRLKQRGQKGTPRWDQTVQRIFMDNIHLHRWTL